MVYTGCLLRLVDSVGQGDARSPAMHQARHPAPRLMAQRLCRVAAVALPPLRCCRCVAAVALRHGFWPCTRRVPLPPAPTCRALLLRRVAGGHGVASGRSVAGVCGALHVERAGGVGG